MFALTGCKKDNEEPENSDLLMAEPNEVLSAGPLNTVFITSTLAFGLPAPGLSNIEDISFFTGNSFFTQNWVSSPASTTAIDGLGPVFNGRSCTACHSRDGRGQPPTGIGDFSGGLLMRLSIPGIDEHGGPNPHPVYGDQLSDRSLPNVPAEGQFNITYEYIEGEFADGSKYEGQW